MQISKLKRVLIGQPIASEHQSHEFIPKWKALAVLSSDALSSVAYATEEILLALVAAAALNWSLPIGAAILVLLVLVTLSYRQTIDSYPNGGGAYIVAKDNLGTTAGLVAGASLLIDYTLTVSVSVASGVENIASAFPLLQEHKILFEVLIILIIMVLSLRGVGESATIFALPAYFFIFSILAMIIWGFYKSHFGELDPITDIANQHYPEIGLFLVLRAFSSGCSALTGVEAISNGVPLFKEPKQQNARVTLTWMAVLLGTMFAGITYLVHVLHLVPTEGTTVISSLSSAVFGDSFMYYFVQVATALILFLAASTSYADFPRLSSLLAKDKFAPRQLASQGDRLVFSNGIIGLSLAAILLVILFGGSTHHLIPLYAVGVFLSFTLSQAGMVVHHIKYKEKNWKISILFNFVGMLATATVLGVIAVTKFTGGAWMVIVLIPIIVFAFRRIHKHYCDCAKELSTATLSNEDMTSPLNHMVIIPISGLHKGVIDALRYGRTISDTIHTCYIEIDPEASEKMQMHWKKMVPDLDLTIVKSPYRSVIGPLLDFIDQALATTTDEYVTVILPEFVTAKWHHQFLHNQTAFLIRTALMFKPRVIVTSVRYHLKTT